MAKAEKIPQESFDVKLTLSYKEAALLKDLTGSVGGVGEVRDALDSIFRVLCGIGVHSNGSHFETSQIIKSDF